jgi:HNH endonuclease
MSVIIALARSRRQFPRFWSKVDLHGPIMPGMGSRCWQWMRAVDKDGYGWFWYSMEEGARHAHRVAYELLIGPIPDGLTIDHLCRNVRCVNPIHMEPVTNAVNIQRGISGILAGQRMAAKQFCPHGHAYDEANTYVNPITGKRACRACHKELARRRRAARA